MNQDTDTTEIPPTWEEFLMIQNQKERGVERDSRELLAEILSRPKSDNPNDATNRIVEILSKQNL